MQIESELRKLDFSRLPFIWGKAHSALIGFWIDWWFSLHNNGLVNEPGREAMTIGGKKRFADVYFAKMGHQKKFKILGIAEIENNKNKWLEKLETLGMHAKAKLDGNLKFPSLRFVILSIPFDEIPRQSEQIYNELITTAKQLSRTIKPKVIIAKFLKTNINESRGEVYAIADMRKKQRMQVIDGYFIWKPFSGLIQIDIFRDGRINRLEIGKKIVGRGIRQSSNPALLERHEN
jgi:hypothetical protein